MEEEVNQRTVTLIVNTSRMTAGILARTMSRWLANEHQTINRHATERKLRKEENEIPHGKMTVQELMEKDAGSESIPINNKDIKEFDKVARKYKIDYAMHKDISTQPPTYYIFFKPRDRDTMSAAFREFITSNNRRQKKKLMKQKLSEYKEMARELNKKRARDKNRTRERSL